MGRLIRRARGMSLLLQLLPSSHPTGLAKPATAVACSARLREIVPWVWFVVGRSRCWNKMLGASWQAAAAAAAAATHSRMHACWCLERAGGRGETGCWVGGWIIEVAQRRE